MHNTTYHYASDHAAIEQSMLEQQEQEILRRSRASDLCRRFGLSLIREQVATDILMDLDENKWYSRLEELKLTFPSWFAKR